MGLFRTKRYLRSRLEPIGISPRVPFGVNTELVERQKEAAARLPHNSVRRLILENEDTKPPHFDKPVNFEDLPT